MPRLAAVPDQPRRMLIYVRQSVEREGSISPEVQERACRDYIAGRGYEAVDVIADVGVSGLKWDKRPGIQRAMKMVADGVADGMVVWRWSRLSRRRVHQAVALDAIEQAGGVVESATEPFDTTTAGGRFGREVMLAAAAFESQQKAEQWAEAHRRRIERGLPASGGSRFGYRLVDGSYVPDAEMGTMLTECYRRYLSGEGLQQLADRLNALGMPSPRSRRWSKRGIAYMMDSGFAAGLIHRSSTGEYLQGAHEPVIDEVTWRGYLAERERRRITAPRLLHAAWRLSGLVTCAHCGYSMTLKSYDGPSSHVRCSRRECDGRPLVARDRVEAAVLDWVPTVAEAVERQRVDRPRVAAEAERARLERRVAAADSALRGLLVDKAKGLVPASVFDAAVAELTAERAEVARILAAADSTVTRIDQAVELATSLAEVWHSADPVAVNRLARELLRVKVTRLSWGSRSVPAEYEVTTRGIWEPI